MPEESLKNGQAGVTPTMVAAGAKILIGYDEELDSYDETAVRIYRVMEAARLQSSEGVSSLPNEMR